MFQTYTTIIPAALSISFGMPIEYRGNVLVAGGREPPDPVDHEADDNESVGEKRQEQKEDQHAFQNRLTLFAKARVSLGLPLCPKRDKRSGIKHHESFTSLFSLTSKANVQIDLID